MHPVILVSFLSSLLLGGGVQRSDGIVTGQLSTKAGVPAANIRVAAMEVTSTNGAALMSVAQTDGAGRYRLENVPQGNYYIVAGPTESLRYYPGVPNATGATAVSVRAGAAVNLSNFAFDPWSNVLRSVRTRGTDQDGKFFGRIFKGTGETLQNVVILLMHGQTQKRFITNSDGSGAFEFSGLPTGGFSIEVLPPLRLGFNGMGYESLQASVSLSANESLQQDFLLRMIMSADIARSKPEIYAAPPLRVRPPAGASPRVGDGIGLMRGGPSASVPVPLSARGQKSETRVDLQVLAGIDGHVMSLRAVSADANPAYVKAALDAALNWTFAPPVLRNQEAAEQFNIITVYFEP